MLFLMLIQMLIFKRFRSNIAIQSTMLIVSSDFRYLFFRFKVSWFYSTFKFVNPSLITCVNLVDFIKIYITCLWKLPFPVISHWSLEEPTTTVDHTELERSKIVLPRDWSEDQKKTFWNFAVLPLLHLFYQKSPSSKSRIKGYLLLVHRDPTTTTHTY